MPDIRNALRTWHEVEAGPEEKASLDALVSPPGGVLAALNRVLVSGPQLRAAIEALQRHPVTCDADVMRHALILSAFAEAQDLGPVDFAGPALHARAIAMDFWCHHHDPAGQSDVDAFFEASARQPLIETNEGIGFEPVSFGALIAFIADLPY